MIWVFLIHFLELALHSDFSLVRLCSKFGCFWQYLVVLNSMPLQCPTCNTILNTPYCGLCASQCLKKSMNPKCCEICHKKSKEHICLLEPCLEVMYCNHSHKHERRPHGNKAIASAKK